MGTNYNGIYQISGKGVDFNAGCLIFGMALGVPALIFGIIWLFNISEDNLLQGILYLIVGLLLVPYTIYSNFWKKKYVKLTGINFNSDKFEIGVLKVRSKEVSKSLWDIGNAKLPTNLKWEKKTEFNMDDTAGILEVREDRNSKKDCFNFSKFHLIQKNKIIYTISNSNYEVFETYSLNDIAVINNSKIFWLINSPNVMENTELILILEQIGQVFNDFQKLKSDFCEIRFSASKVDKSYTLLHGLVGGLISATIDKYRASHLRKKLGSQVIFTQEFTDKFINLLDCYKFNCSFVERSKT